MKQEELNPSEQIKTPEATETDAVENQEEISIEKMSETISTESAEAIQEEDQLLEEGMKNLGFSQEESDIIGQETGISEELAGNESEIRALADESTKQFTKEYSQSFRNAEAAKIRAMRKTYFEKKQSVTEENDTRAVKRSEIQNELSRIESQMAEQKETLNRLDDEIEDRKSTVWFKIKNTLGLIDELPEEKQFREQISELKDMNREAAEKRNLLTETEDVVLDDAELKLAREDVRKFYEEQKGIKDVFENEKTKERGLAQIAKQKQVLFLHGLPTGGTEANTAANNPNVATSAMSFVDRAKALIGLEPTASVSTKQLSPDGVAREKEMVAKNQRFGSGEKPVLYQAGLILNGGSIVSAYGGDAGTVAEGTRTRLSKYDARLRSSVQEDFSKNLDDAIEHRVAEGSGIAESAINELVIEKPSVSGSFAYLESPMGYEIWSGNGYAKNEETYERYRNEVVEKQLGFIKAALELSKELGIPAYAVGSEGSLMDLLHDDFQGVLSEEVMDKKFDFSIEDRIEYIKNAMGFSRSESMSAEAERKMDELRQLETEESSLVANRENYRSKAKNILDSLNEKNDDTFEWLREEVLSGAITPTATTPEVLQFLQNERGLTPRGVDAISEILSRYATADDALRGYAENKLLRKKLIEKIKDQDYLLAENSEK